MAFKMKGSSLYGKLNLNRGGQANRPDGRAKSSAFQKDEEKNEWGETPEEYKQRMIDMGLRKSDAKEEIDSKENKKASKRDKAAEKSGAPLKSSGKITDPKKDSKGNVSFTDKTNKADQTLINKALNKTKTGGKGATDEERKATLKATRRQETRDSYNKSKKELNKEAGGSKIKNFFTSKKKLRSKVNANRLRDMKSTQGQVMDTKTKDALGGDKYTKTS